MFGVLLGHHPCYLTPGRRQLVYEPPCGVENLLCPSGLTGGVCDTPWYRFCCPTQDPYNVLHMSHILTHTWSHTQPHIQSHTYIAAYTGSTTSSFEYYNKIKIVGLGIMLRLKYCKFVLIFFHKIKITFQWGVFIYPFQ